MTSTQPVYSRAFPAPLLVFPILLGMVCAQPVPLSPAHSLTPLLVCLIHSPY